MKIIKSLLLVLVVLAQSSIPVNAYAAPEKKSTTTTVKALVWQDWTADLFTQSETGKKLILLNLEAVWCHWCHVMDLETYSKPEVKKLLAENFTLVRVDQDARPDLANRYKDYGWPATIIFDAAGTELVKLTGFIPAGEFSETLKRVIENPVPQSAADGGQDLAYAEKPVLSSKLREQLEARHYATADPILGGLTTDHKFLDADSVELALIRSKQDSAKDNEMALRTLRYGLRLIDPVWGGVYQYSTGGDWDHPHFEKIIPTQASNLRIYSLAYGLKQEVAFLKAAMEIYRYLKDFMTASDGAFYASQDADVKRGEHAESYFSLGDAGRRGKGIPAIDTNIYARENGLMIEALVALYEATGNDAVLHDAVGAAEAIQKRRARPDGGYSHGEKDSAGPYLGDNLAMGQAFLVLYRATGNRDYLARAESAAGFISTHFVATGENAEPGLYTSSLDTSGSLFPVRSIEENIKGVRFFNLLARFTGNQGYRTIAEQAMRYLGTEQVALKNVTEAGILIAENELRTAPLHLTIVGAKADPAADALYHEALRYFAPYKRLEWWDQSEGPLPNPDVSYPPAAVASAFICTDRRCSLPITDPKLLQSTIDTIVGKK